jgi:hypothetical protein
MLGRTISNLGNVQFGHKDLDFILGKYIMFKSDRCGKIIRNDTNPPSFSRGLLRICNCNSQNSKNWIYIQPWSSKCQRNDLIYSHGFF